ncbi:MAG: hypothetical protein RL033_5492 [Pseudomonadota bacterium]|jgi:hypothetical protein
MANMTRRRSNWNGSAGTSFLSARSALLASGLTAASIWACSSSVDLAPVPEQAEMEELNPPRGAAGAGGGQIVSPSNPDNEVMPTPTLVTAGAGGGSGDRMGTGGAQPMGSAGAGAGGMPPVMMGGAAGAPPCADTDGDGRCNEVDRCPEVRDDGTDGDGDGRPNACDPCPELQDDGSDADGDGIGDACDPCGIGFALDLAPLYYFSLDEAATATTAVNRGSAAQAAVYVGPVERGLAGVSDPRGRAIRLAGGVNGEFSRVSVLNVSTFPSTALTATFWIRTTREGDYGIISYAIPGSSNEFGIVVDDGQLRLTLESAVFATDDLDVSALNDGAWHFVALVWDQTLAQFYIDGEAAGAVIQTEPGFEQDIPGNVNLLGIPSLSSGFGGGALVLGQDQDSVNGGFNLDQALLGGLDEVGIYAQALTEEQIRRIFTETTCGEICDGADNDGDGLTDEGFLGTIAACGAASCAALTDNDSAFGTGEYASSVNPDVPLVCNF